MFILFILWMFIASKEIALMILVTYNNPDKYQIYYWQHNSSHLM